MSPRKASIAPKPRQVLADHRNGLGWGKSLCELVDNSYDAGATSISIEFDKKMVRISDNGCGIRDIIAALQSGNHVKHSTTALGMYGVGLTDAAKYFWGITSISSVHNGILRSAEVDWEAIAAAPEWDIFVPDDCEATPEACALWKVNPSHGTTITFRKILPASPNFEAERERLGYTFASAIKSGRGIVLHRNGKDFPVSAFEPPVLENVVEVAGDINGKGYRLRAGIVPEGIENEHRGFNLSYKHRTITNTTEGCGQYGASRFFGWVDLDSSWKLSRHKDELFEDGPVLASALYYHCEEQLRSASMQARSIELAGIENEISGILKQNISDAEAPNVRKEKRPNRGATKGTRKPKGTGTRRRTATVSSSESGGLSGAVGSDIKLEFEKASKSKHVGRVEINSAVIRVVLWLEHPRIKQDFENKAAILWAASSVLAIHAATTPNQKERQRLLGFASGEKTIEFFHAALSGYLGGYSTDKQNCDATEPEAACV